jgi:hypothetical protein
MDLSVGCEIYNAVTACPEQDGWLRQKKSITFYKIVVYL